MATAILKYLLVSYSIFSRAGCNNIFISYLVWVLFSREFLEYRYLLFVTTRKWIQIDTVKTFQLFLLQLNKFQPNINAYEVYMLNYAIYHGYEFHRQNNKKYNKEFSE